MLLLWHSSLIHVLLAAVLSSGIAAAQQNRLAAFIGDAACGGSTFTNYSVPLNADFRQVQCVEGSRQTPEVSEGGRVLVWCEGSDLLFGWCPQRHADAAQDCDLTCSSDEHSDVFRIAPQKQDAFQRGECVHISGSEFLGQVISVRLESSLQLFDGGCLAPVARDLHEAQLVYVDTTVEDTVTTTTTILTGPGAAVGAGLCLGAMACLCLLISSLCVVNKVKRFSA
mmetsp:Transcript_55238/g.131679  ORF Transcript_55238/g.131679 Transcript_55238/m.131679 type:complete len:226 (-) Transcript_55238:82-759(-)